MKIKKINKNDTGKEKVDFLCDVDWFDINNTETFQIKKYIGNLFRSINPKNINENIHINDVLKCLRECGYEVVKIKE